MYSDVGELRTMSVIYFSLFVSMCFYMVHLFIFSFVIIMLYISHSLLRILCIVSFINVACNPFFLKICAIIRISL